ncbi:hypothetical protein QVD17_37375 [Tagetes erecta]|uniref:Wall-associated receptor kinase galacturonan-binding domain-containing protein n=1 Tax=Tagetes erecta TaxID=13708 RepID=A0AAD8JWC5_TARER|nr:hypothetical protein QVD17_37375 [Tagetes erecta]
MPGCNHMCGNVMIPYPFGIGAGCSVNQWYNVDCNSSTPYLPSLNNLQVWSVNLRNMTVTVITPRVTNCQNPILNSREIMGVDLGESPFFFSKYFNKFVLEGCGSAVMMMDNGSVLTGCATTCRSYTLIDRNNCFGTGCCEKTELPGYLKSYNINLTSLEGGDGRCGSAFLADKSSYDQGRLSSVVPVSLLWTLADSDQVTCCNNLTGQIYKVEMFNGTHGDTFACPQVISSQGSPYLIDGCAGIPLKKIYDTLERKFSNRIPLIFGSRAVTASYELCIFLVVLGRPQADSKLGINLWGAEGLPRS